MIGFSPFCCLMEAGVCAMVVVHMMDFFDGVIDPFVNGGGGAFIHRAKNHGRPASH